jgi:hypothetical protein
MSLVMTLLGAALLTGCVGTGSFVHDTTRLPGRTPNAPAGTALNQQRVQVSTTAAAAMPPVKLEPGAAWPGPPKPIPSLQDLQRQQNEAMAQGGFVPHPMAGDLPKMPGFPIPQPEENPAPPKESFPTGLVSGVEGKALGTTGGALESQAVPPPDAQGNVVVPNGDGTSTVIGPNGSVTTLPKKN